MTPKEIRKHIEDFLLNSRNKITIISSKKQLNYAIDDYIKNLKL